MNRYERQAARRYNHRSAITSCWQWGDYSCLRCIWHEVGGGRRRAVTAFKAQR